jgi:anaerobic selenocysteine-containing dehydrogenase
LQVRTLCRSCSAACGIVVDIEHRDPHGVDRNGLAPEARVVRVRGDAANPRSQGYICPKGASLAEFHHRTTRLVQPRLHGRRATWDACLDDLGATLTRLRSETGPDSIALYQGTGAVSDSLALPAIQQFMAGLGTRQFYTAATVDVAPALRAAEMVCGFYHPWPVWVPENPASRLAILIGFNPALSHGYLTLLPNATERLRAFRARGGELFVVDPRRTRTASLADHHLSPRPGTDAILLAWLLRDALAANAEPGANASPRAQAFQDLTTATDRDALSRALADLTLERVCAETGLAAAEIESLVAAIRRAGRISIVAATGVTLSRDALLCEWLRWALLIATDSLDAEGGMWFNPGVLTRYEETGLLAPLAPPEGRVAPGPRSRPELSRILDQHPCVALVDEIEAGHVRALFVAGSSPLTAFPEPERLRRAFARLDALVALDVVETPLAAMATHVLPATGQLERADLVTETQTAYAPAVVRPVALRKPMWWSFAQLGRRLGLDVLGDALDPDETRDEALIERMATSARGGAAALLDAGPDGISPPAAYGWVRKRALPEGRFRLVPPGLLERLRERLARPVGEDRFVLVAARQLTRTNATPYMAPAKSPDDVRLRVHPRDAEDLGFEPGARIQLKSSRGSLEAMLAIDADLRRGVVSLAHGWPDTNVCGLTSSSQDIDALTGQPPMTAIPISLTRSELPR